MGAVRRRRVLGVCLALSFLITAGTAIGDEPVGRVRFLPRWIEGAAEVDPPAGGVGVLRLEIHPFVSVQGARFTASVPPGLEVEPIAVPAGARFRPVPSGNDDLWIQVSLGTLAKAAPLTFDFRLGHLTEKGGIADFFIEGTTEEGVAFREAVGVPVGHPGTQGVLRHGAIEFPAVPGPEEER